ncbi:hypothetical protein IU452_26975 [Nocardia transvalensis]|nr:hypothetical protein [Nocardia transvalensis]
MPYVRGTRSPRAAATPVRQLHRWSAIVLVSTVLVTVVDLALQGPIWVSYLPLLPLTVLLFSGLYMFVRLPAAGITYTRSAVSRGLRPWQ